MVKTLLQPAVRLCNCMASSIHHPCFIQRHEHHMHASLTRAQMTGWPHVRAVDNFIQNIRNRRLFISFPSSLSSFPSTSGDPTANPHGAQLNPAITP